VASASAGKLGDFPVGQVREVVVLGRILAISNVGGTLFATDGTCLHRGGPIGQGDLDGKIVTCPLHGWTYDVTTGQSFINPAAKLRTFPVTVEGETVLVDL